jgi:hypothetical protein
MEHCEGAVQRCPPRQYAEIPESQDVLFSKALDQPKFTNIASAKKMVLTIGTDGRTEVKDWEFLHVEKIGPRVERTLMGRNMLRESPVDSEWKIVPRGVGGLILSMVADQIAQHKGFDAVTDQPLAFALNAVHSCAGSDSAQLEGIVASTIVSVHVPKAIAFLPVDEYAELRKNHAEARPEFARMVKELKEDARLSRSTDPADFRGRIDDITQTVDKQLQKFRKSKLAAKYDEWVPFLMTSLIPVGATLVFGPVPGLVTAGFTFTVTAVGKLTKKNSQWRYPTVLQTLCAAQEMSWQAEIEKLT